MPLIAWTPDYSVGHADLDADHRNLVDLLNALHEAWETGEDAAVLHGICGELMMYTDYHFQREERLLAAAGYERLDHQREQHARLKEQVEAFRTRHLTGPAPALTAEVETFLRNWMMSHILDEDMKYRGRL